jgi:hypothetical protein
MTSEACACVRPLFIALLRTIADWHTRPRGGCAGSHTGQQRCGDQRRLCHQKLTTAVHSGAMLSLGIVTLIARCKVSFR